jgi:SAM-dependent methyltransferase
VTRASNAPPGLDDAVIWHDTECGAYDGDLRLWEELAAAHGDPVLELGAGTGRVALHLARRAHSVVAVEQHAELARELDRRARAAGVEVEVMRGAAEELAIEGRFPLVLAPMQLIQLIGGPARRHAALAATIACLRPGGILAAAIVDGLPPEALPPDGDEEAPLPDLREVDGWVYASTPLGVAVVGDWIEITRRRQVVAPDGRITERLHVDRLALADADQLEAEAKAAGLRPADRVAIAPTESHVGSTVLILEAPA